ncbi:MerR family transcriptional regulator [Nocardioides sp. Soil805]|uniref:MerR family transcriptional regulator n=1 Tax=Nocardioides sp. Soil805 TaxID=1736416 RepID=UPI00070252BE|nr:MerR family transcriptional regulator [Nocardioides sp. Soil805]KRF36767.1 hypothetical protein ASG94_04970 [Nocardioides sp. Soil805]
MYTVKRAAELTGLSPDTLRMWERRYAVVEPERSPGGYRLYDDAALRRLAAMKSLVDAGWSVRAAATRVLSGSPDEVVVADRPPEAAFGDVEALVSVARDFDARALDGVLDEGFALGGYEQVVDEWLLPALGRLGRAWREGSVTVAGEHFVSAGVQRRLATLFDAAAHEGEGPVVVVGLARGSRHELGVLAFSVALRRAGLQVVYVGGDLPPEGWVETVRARGARAVVIGVPSIEDVPAVRECVDVLVRAAPDVAVHLGGGYQDDVSGPARRLGHEIGGGSSALAAELASRSGPRGGVGGVQSSAGERRAT